VAVTVINGYVLLRDIVMYMMIHRQNLRLVLHALDR